MTTECVSVKKGENLRPKRILEIPPAFFDPRSLDIIKIIRNKEMLPEDICVRTSHGEKVVVSILLNLHVYGVLRRKQKGFKGYYSVSKDGVMKYSEKLRTLSEKWQTLLQEVEM